MSSKEQHELHLAESRKEWQQKMESTSLHLLKELGPWAAHGFLDRLTYAPQLADRPAPVPSAASGVESSAMATGGVDGIVTPGTAGSTDDPSAAPSSSSAEEAGTEVKLDLRTSDQGVLTQINDSNLLCPHRLPPDKWEMTPKVRALLEILDIQSRRPGFSGIVFVQRRQSAIWLAELIRRSKRLANCKLNAAAVVGHGEHRSSDPTSDSMHLKDQHNILTSFRAGKVNLLVATSLIEEGLDVMACTLVVRFDVFHTLASYVQSRGRARHPYSLYVLMVESDSKEKLRQMLAAAHSEEQLVREVANEDRALLRIREGEEVSEEFLGKEKVYRVEETGALATVNSAVALVYQYCTQLPRDKFCHMQPVFIFETDDKGSVCTIEMPINAAVRRVTSERYADEPSAKRSACLEACKQLHKCNALTDHLLPRKLLKEGIGETELDPDPFAGLGKGRRMHTYTVHGPRCLCAPPQVTPAKTVAELPSVLLFVYKIYVAHDFNDHRSFAFVSHNPLPYIKQFEVYDKSIDGNFMTGLKPLGRYHVDVQSLNACRRFNAALWGCLTSVKPNEVTYRQGRDHTTYMVLPLSSTFSSSGTDESIPEGEWADASSCEILQGCSDAWSIFDQVTMEKVVAMADPKTWEPVDLTNLESIPGRVVVTRYNMQKYLVKGFTEKTPRSTFPTDGRKEDSLTLNEALPFPPGHRAIRTAQTELPNMAAASVTANPANGEIEERNYDTYADYYEKSWKEKVQPDQPLMHAEFTGVRHMIPHVKRKIKASDSVLLIPELCLLFPLSHTAFFIPSFCIRVERLLNLEQLKAEIGIPVDSDLFEEAMTTPSGNPITNYERLENLGDALLKYTVSMHLFLKYPKLHEGQLSVMRMQMVNNKILCEHAVSKHVFHYLVHAPPLPKSWAPPGSPHRARIIADKTMADIMESLIGAYYKTRNSLEDALAFMSWAGIMVCDPEPVLHPEKFWAREGEPRRRNVGQALVLAGPLANFEQLRLGYIFTHKPLLVEAFTHASFKRAATPCYQRLEFLGDAVLDYYVTTDLYNNFPDIGPGKMSDLRMAGVNNEILAAIAVSHGYHHCLYHHSADLLGEMTVFVRWIAAGGTVAAASADEDRAADAPKVLGDLFESIAAAVMLDSGTEATGIVIRRLMKPYLDRYATPDTVVMDPRRKLQEICTLKGIFDYTEYRIVQGEERGGMGIGVFLKGQQIGFGEGGRFVRAKRTAARRAVRWLEQRDEQEAKELNRAAAKMARVGVSGTSSEGQMSVEGPASDSTVPPPDVIEDDGGGVRMMVEEVE